MELNTEITLPIFTQYAEYTAQEHRRDLLGIKQMLNKDEGLKEYLVTARADAPEKGFCTSCTATGMCMADVKNVHVVCANLRT